MRLKMLAIAAGFALPVIAAAQVPTDTTKRDTTAMPMTPTPTTTVPTTTEPTTTAPTTPVTTEPAPTTPTNTLVPTAPTPTPVPTTTEPIPATTEPAPTTSTTAQVPRAPKDSTPGPHAAPPSDGTTCPWGCPTSAGAAGLTGPQFLALQQELRDRKCGLPHVTGRLDAATRTAIRNCARKMGVANSAAAVLIAADVGYGPSDVNKSGS